MQRCKIWNNLDYQGQQQSDLEDNGVSLVIAFSELDRDCPFCRVVILSTESIVTKDYWNARPIDPENGEDMSTYLSLQLVKDEPIRGGLVFKYDTPELTKRDGRNTWSSSKRPRESLKFLIYSADEVSSLP